MGRVDESLHIAAISQGSCNLHSSRKVFSKIFVNDIDCVGCITNICTNQQPTKCKSYYTWCTKTADLLITTMFLVSGLHDNEICITGND